jgi:peptidoglycan/LPS O-acetylase OafA/YrhL
MADPSLSGPNRPVGGRFPYHLDVSRLPRWRLGHRPALDGLRGVAVLIVVADHAGFLREPAGSIGVTVFFVLSGFLITRVIVEARDDRTWSMKGFLANRFVRLFPALVVMLTVVSAIFLARGYPLGQLLIRTVPGLTYVQNMVPLVHYEIVGQTWSLGVEEQFYLLWPLVLPWVIARSRPRVILVVAMLASAASMIALPRDWLPMHAYALLAGCALALAGPVTRRWWLVPLGAVGLIASIAVAPDFSQIFVYGPMIAVPSAVLLVAGAAGGDRVLALPPLRFVGRISYAVYLWHVPLIKLAHATHTGEPALRPVAISFVVATASTLLLEEPLRRGWKRRQGHADRERRQASVIA